MLRDDDVRDKDAPIPAEEGLGNSYSTEFRGYDPRRGQWLSIDPLAYKFPWSSSYVAMGNNPIIMVDTDGKAEYLATDNTIYDDGVDDKLKYALDKRLLASILDPPLLNEFF